MTKKILWTLVGLALVAGIGCSTKNPRLNAIGMIHPRSKIVLELEEREVWARSKNGGYECISRCN